MHGVRRDLLRRQSELLRLPVEEVWISKGAANMEYEAQMAKSLSKFYAVGVRHVVFGDLFLEDIRKYREEQLSRVNMAAVFPLWHRDTSQLADYFISQGFKAIVCCVDPRALGKNFCGRDFDGSFISDLPHGVDPCGENGEFHTFVYAGPIFDGEIPVKTGEVLLREGFYFADIIPS